MTRRLWTRDTVACRPSSMPGAKAALDRITHIMPELTLDNQQWDALARHLHRVGVAQLVWGEAPTHPGAAGRLV
jgi:hypothetical protein